MDKKNLRKKDLIASLILLAVGIFVLVDSFRMIFFVDLPGVEEVGWFVAPGIFPFMLSVGIIVMSLIMLSIAYRESGRIKFESWRKFRKYFKSKDTIIMMTEIGLLFFYAFVLLKKVHFTLATFIYLFLSMFVVKAASWYKIAMISVLAAVVIAYLFGNLFKIPLP
jgi:hypothetical protein